MSARFEVCRGDTGWWARFRAANGRIVWTTETYTRRTAAYGALSSLATEFGYRWMPPVKDAGMDLEHWVHRDAGWRIAIREVDERTPLPPPLTAEPPFFVGFPLGGESWWHDHDFHWRFCGGEDCSEGTPPAGTKIRVRFGEVTA